AFIHFADASALPAQPQLVNDRPEPGQFKKLAGPDGIEARKELGSARRNDLIAMETWFLDRMIGSPAPLQEKMTLFWHGHFTSAYQKGIPAQALVDQNNLFRQYALGNIRDLTLKV